MPGEKFHIEDYFLAASFSKHFRPGGRGEGVLPITDYTGRLRPKGVPFLDWRYVKG